MSNVTSPCFDDEVQFVMLRTAMTFEEGMDACLDHEGTIGSIRNQVEFDFVQTELVETFDLSGRFWVGLREDSAILPANSPDRFEFIDGHSNKSFFIEPFVFPWTSIEPDRGGPNEFCIQ